GLRPDAGQPPGGRPAEGWLTVAVLGLPLSVYRVVEEHNDALMREFAMIAKRPDAPGAPRRLVELVEEARARFPQEAESSRSQVEAAVEAGESSVDVELVVPVAARGMIIRLVELLDEADAFCEQGELLTLASPPEVRRLRSWFLDQVLRQLDGLPAERWPWPED
ncbi:MAG: hypothetical protein ACRDYD_14285, partial [Acidimicrobiales bacterium]